MRRSLTIVLLSAGLLLTGCSFLVPTGPTILYDEAFSGTTAWYQGETDDKRFWVEDGAYHVLAKTSDVFYYSWRSQIGPFTDFQYDVDTHQIASPDDNGYGLVFRKNDAGYYRFRISGDGWARFDKYVNNSYVVIRQWERTTLINQGVAANHITAIVDGSQFSFYVNGTLLYTAVDTEFSSGSIGVGAICLDDAGGLHVAFDNVLLQTLE